MLDSWLPGPVHMWARVGGGSAERAEGRSAGAARAGSAPGGAERSRGLINVGKVYPAGIRTRWVRRLCGGRDQGSRLRGYHPRAQRGRAHPAAVRHGPLREITTPQVRRWRTDLLDADVGRATVSKAYQVLRAIMNTAVDDGLIQRNPCQIKGAGSVTHTERPFLSVAEVYRLADAAPPH